VRESRREPAWKFGLLLQGASMLVLLASSRTRYTPLLGVGPLLETTVAVTAVFLAAGSAWVIWEAQRVLGRQFAYQARLIEGHRLITHGPYGWVRNPQYAALFVLGVATAVTWSRWTALPAFLALYAAGTAIRVRCEEKLLREAFGEEFEAYRCRVPALFPRLPRRLSGP